jgi:hypothetical protein
MTLPIKAVIRRVQTNSDARKPIWTNFAIFAVVCGVIKEEEGVEMRGRGVKMICQ